MCVCAYVCIHVIYIYMYICVFFVYRLDTHTHTIQTDVFSALAVCPVEHNVDQWENMLAAHLVLAGRVWANCLGLTTATAFVLV